VALDKVISKRVRKTKAERRQEIIEATLVLIGKYGLFGVSVARIAHAVGLSKSALYRHFKNREEVIIAAIDVMAERSRGQVLQSSAPTSFERLQMVSDSRAAWTATRVDTFLRPGFAIMAAAKQARLSKYISRSVRETFEDLLAMVREGQRQGKVRTDVNPEDVAWAVLSRWWAEDVAVLFGTEELIGGGASSRNFNRLLAVFAESPRELAEAGE
jgi:AcrR family transcriptional regulator